VKRWAAALALAVASGAGAARIETLVVGHAAGQFTVASTMVLDAPPAAVRAALTDFAHLGRLSPAIQESRVVGSTADGPLVFTRSKACAMWFCRELTKTELVTVHGDEIVAIAVASGGPEPSTVTHSITRWRLAPLGAGTRVGIQSEVDPAFFVPPLLGPPLVKKAMRRETEALARGLETAARALARATAEPPAAPPPPEPDGGG
jgi:carbon monoxide dehydrogenase subunit G